MAKYKGAFPKLPERGWFQKGDKGEEVKKLQKLINWANSGTIVATLKVDGEIGDITVRQISFMQEIHLLTIDGEFGKVSLNTLKGLNMNGAWRACNFALSVAKDNRFTYGTGKRAHRCGCYFCETNTGKRKKNKERKGEPHVVKDSKGNGHTYTMTYCCNTLITAAYAHGAKDPKMLKTCRACNAAGMNVKEWTDRNFKKLGRCKDVAFSKLKAGDVIISPTHVYMAMGGDWFIEAGSEGWGSDSIAKKKGAKKRYTQYQKKSGTYVVRYAG